MKARVPLSDALVLNDAVRATWDVSLVRTPRVLVPVVVDALVVTDADGGSAWADCRMTPPPEGDDKPDARSLMPAPFKDLDQPRQPGVYLHWALPDGLTKGSVSTDAGTNAAQVTLPAAPDRWVVLRLSAGRERGRRAVRGWVLEAGGADGVAHDLHGWQGPGATPAMRKPLTALGHGDPAWAAYYDNVENRFAFHDVAEDARGPLAYLVCGWYADPALDPLGSGIASLSAFDRAMSDLGWSLQGELRESWMVFVKRMLGARDAGLHGRDLGSAHHRPERDADGNYVTAGDWWPAGTLFHGAAVNIEGPGGTKVPGGPPAVEDLRVAFGATTGEALAALVAAAAHDSTEERLVEALQLGVLHELDQADGQARLDVVLHASGFGSLSGGPDETETIWEPPVPPQPDPPAEPGTPGAGVFANRRAGGALVKKGLAEEASGVRAKALLVDGAGDAGPAPATGPNKVAGARVVRAGLRDLIDRQAIAGVTEKPTPHPGRGVEVKRPQPRFHHPVDPVVLVQGGKRSFKHGSDDRLTDDGTLPCRLSGFTVTAMSADLGGDRPAKGTLTGGQLLESGVDNGSVPMECEDLLRETVLLDPGSADAAVAQLTAGLERRAPAGGAGAAGRLRDNWQVEQTAWWITNDPRVDPAPVLAMSGATGTLPAAIAITPPQQPWNPLHVDWKVEFSPSATGIAEWDLSEVDLEPGESTSAAAPTAPVVPVVLQGRTLITPGAARTLAEAARQAIDAASKSGSTGTLDAKSVVRHGTPTAALLAEARMTATRAAMQIIEERFGGTKPELSSLVELLDRMDVLGGALEGFHLQLRKQVPSTAPLRPDGTSDPSPITAPPGFLSLRAGTARVTGLRLVDGFGQYLDLTDGPASDADIILGETVRRPASPGHAVLAPRFTAPTRLQFRWAGAGDDSHALGANPVCGFVVPDHLDGGLEFFAADGTNLGLVRPDDHPDHLGSLLWEDAPGTPTTVGRPPSLDVANSHLRGVADGLLDWGMADDGTRPGGTATEEGALEALLRIIDSTMWTVDPFGHTGDEHLALLIGHPVVVMRAWLRLEVVDPATPPELAWTPVPVRLGALTQWQDGLLGFFVDDDYRTIHCAPAAAQMAREVGPRRGFLQQANLVAQTYDHFSDDLAAPGDLTGVSPVIHPYVAQSDVILVRPNQDVRLTLLVEPHTLVHATAGVVPRKDIGMRREWVASALASLAPTFRFGPVLRDPHTLRMPIATDLAGTWTWSSRADVARWTEEQIVNAGQDAQLDDTPTEGSEGWLRLTPPKPGPNPQPGGSA